MRMTLKFWENKKHTIYTRKMTIFVTRAMLLRKQFFFFSFSMININCIYVISKYLIFTINTKCWNQFIYKYFMKKFFFRFFMLFLCKIFKQYLSKRECLSHILSKISFIYLEEKNQYSWGCVIVNEEKISFFWNSIVNVDIIVIFGIFFLRVLKILLWFAFLRIRI